MKNLLFSLLSLLLLLGCESETQERKIKSTESNLATDSLPEGVGKETYVGGMGGNDSTNSTAVKEESEKESTPEKEEVNSQIENKSESNPSENNTETSEVEEIKAEEKKEEKEIEKQEPPQVKAEIHKTWDDLTRKHITSSGKVDYAGFKKDKTELEKYIKELQSYHKDVSTWGKNKRLAYWINVYNAVTVKLIVNNYPVKSITDLYGGKPWDQKLINLGGTDYSLDVIENKIIIAKFNEPRIHFAVNCAAKSCPKILNRAWTEDNIQRYLTKQTKAFLTNSSQNKITKDKVTISKIFDWYKKDFGTTDENVIKFINKYSDTEVNSTATVAYNDYDWSLNN